MLEPTLAGSELKTFKIFEYLNWRFGYRIFHRESTGRILYRGHGVSAESDPTIAQEA